MKLGRLIIIGGLVTIILIFLYSFVLYGSSQPEPETDKFNMKKRMEKTSGNTFPPADSWPKDGIDVVYIWKNPQDDSFHESHDKHFSQVVQSTDFIVESLPQNVVFYNHYFVRGIERFMPWFRKLIVLAPDEVTSIPFNTSHPKLRLVRYSEFIKEDVLPVYNWRSVLLHFVTDPELSNRFIVVDDHTIAFKLMCFDRFMNKEGHLRLPVFNANFSVGFDKADEQLLHYTNQILLSSIQDKKDRLDFNFDISSALAKLPKIDFESRGVQMLDKNVLGDIFQVCRAPIEETKLHRFRNKKSIDPIQLHHQFLYTMSSLIYQNNSDDKSIKPNNLQTHQHLQFELTPSLTSAIEYLEGEKVPMTRLASYINAAENTTDMWLGTVILTERGENARYLVEEQLQGILSIHSNLEFYEHAGVGTSTLIGVGFLLFCILGCFSLTKYITNSPKTTQKSWN